MTLPISALDSPSLVMVWLVVSATVTALLATRAASLAFLEISRMDACISSGLAATTFTFLETSSLAADTTLACVAHDHMGPMRRSPSCPGPALRARRPGRK